MIGCALFTPFALWQAERLEPELRGKTLVTLKKNKVVAVSSNAREAGIELRMSLDGARARCDDLVIVETNDATLQHAWEEVLGRLYSFTDRIEASAPGLVFLDTTEADASRITEQFWARVALGETQEHTHLKALAAVTEKPLTRKSREARIDKCGNVKEIPIGVLSGIGLGKKAVQHLGWLGVETVGELQRWSKTQLASYFGKEAALLVRYLKGPCRESVNRYTPMVTLTASYNFEDTATEPWQLDPVMAHLVSSLNEQLEDKAAARLTLVAESQGLAFTATRVSKEPLRGERLLLGQVLPRSRRQRRAGLRCRRSEARAVRPLPAERSRHHVPGQGECAESRGSGRCPLPRCSTAVRDAEPSLARLRVQSPARGRGSH